MIEIIDRVVYLPVSPNELPSIDLILNRYVQNRITELKNNLHEVTKIYPEIGTTVIIQGSLARTNHVNFLDPIHINFALSGDDTLDIQIQSQIDMFYSTR